MKKTNKLRYTLLLVLLLLTSGIIRAQMGEQRHNFAVGVNGGVNLSSVSFQPTVNQKNLMGINAGLTARYICEKYFSMICGAQVELNFSGRGWSETSDDYPELSYERLMNYVEVPFLAHIAFGRDRGLQFFIHAGPQIGFLLGDKETIDDNVWNGILNQGAPIETTQHHKKIDNRFDYGITGGAGLELRTGAGNFLLEGRYYYALSDFYGNTKKDYFGRSAHSVITVKLSYLFDLRK